MNIHNKTIAKITQMPDYLVKEVSEYIDYLLWKHAKEDISNSIYLSESQKLVEADFSNYLLNLEDYETHDRKWRNSMVNI